MNVFIVYAHPSEDSFTKFVRDSFIDGLKTAGHSYIISDLYKMNFATDMSESEYLRESNYREDLPLPDDIILEQEKINSSEAIVFIYPVFWTEAPAKLVGWFDRVWTCGFAYGNYESMKTVMLGDRMFDRVNDKNMIILDSMTKYSMEARQANWDKHLETAFEAGRTL